MKALIGIFSIKESQWTDFLEVMDDSETNYSTWKEWKKGTEKLEKEIKKNGDEVVRLPLDLNDFQLWCRTNDRAKDGPTRAEYLAHKVKKFELENL